jgi:hypothetical protein
MGTGQAPIALSNGHYRSTDHMLGTIRNPSA